MVTPVRYLHAHAMNGTISEGKNADLIVLNKSKRININNTRTIEGVFLKGTWLDRSAIDAMLQQVEAAYK